MTREYSFLYISEYFQCDNGEAGVVFVCGASLKFDKVRNECHPEQYVSSYCYGPPKEKEITESSALCPEEYIGWGSQNNCSEYFHCDRGHIGVVYTCPEDLLFDKALEECVSAGQFACREGEGGVAMPRESSSPTSVADSITMDDIVNGGVVGDHNWSNAPMSSRTQNTANTPPWLSNTVMATNSGNCILGGGRSLLWLHCGASMIFFLWLTPCCC
jgi:hypothetical protein